MTLMQTVRQIQRLRSPNAFQRKATTFANGCAFVNPPPQATPAQSETWAARWLKHYDTSVALESKATPAAPQQREAGQ